MLTYAVCTLWGERGKVLPKYLHRGKMQNCAQRNGEDIPLCKHCKERMTTMTTQYIQVVLHNTARHRLEVRKILPGKQKHF